MAAVTLRLVRAFLWLRIRGFLHSFRSTSRHDTLEQISRIASGMLPIVAVLVLVPSCIALAAGGFLAGRTMSHGNSPFIGPVMVVGRIVLLAVMLANIVAPAVKSARGPAQGLSRLLLLPVRRRLLHVAQVLAGFSDPWLALMVPPLIFLSLGLISAGSLLAGLSALTAGVLCLLVLALLTTTVGFAAALLFRNRRRAEWISLVLMTLLAVAGMSIGLFSSDSGWEERARDGDARFVLDFIPDWLTFFPSELYFHALSLSLDADPGWEPLWPILGLAAWCLGLYVLSSMAYSRLLETPESGGGGIRKRRSAPRWIRIAGFSPTVSAVAVALVRLALRTVRGKMAVFLNFIMVGLMYLIVSTQLRRMSEFSLPEELSFGMLITLAGFVFTQLSLQPVMYNVFAIDRAGLTLQTLAPISVREMALGKLVGSALLVAISTALCAATGWVLAPGGDFMLWLALACICGSALALVGPAALCLSAILPKTADLGRFGRPGNQHALAGFIGVALAALSVAPGGLTTAIGLFLFESSALAFLFSAAWLVVAGLLAIPLQRLAGRLFERRRETLLQVAVGR